ncbi:hypothetical protein D3C71_1462550 [compost metagenome]
MYSNQNDFDQFIEYLELEVNPGHASESDHRFIKDNCIFFHATPVSKVESIKKNGFSLNSNNAVFFAKSYIRSKEYAQRIHNILEVAIFAVDLSYITVENYNSYYNPNSRELRSREVIPADKIIGIHSI